MSTQRILFPFTSGVDIDVFRSVLQFAKAARLTLVTLALIPVAEQSSPADIRPESIQQVKDFLVMAQSFAEMYQVPLEQQEVVTSDFRTTVYATARQRACQSILMVYCDQVLHFISSPEAQQLEQTKDCQLYVLRLPAMKRRNPWSSVWPAFRLRRAHNVSPLVHDGSLVRNN